MSQTPPIVFGPRRSSSTEDEWLVTDGLGGYATGTVSGLRTRRGHALLSTAGHVGLVSLDLTVTLPSGAKVPLYTHKWVSGFVAPQGHLHLETFSLIDGLPRWRWRIGDVVVERQLAMSAAGVAVVHRVVSAPGPVGLAVAAMCTWREAGGDRHAIDPVLKVEQVAGGVVVEDSYRVTGPGWQPGGEWHLGAATDGDEDLWLAGTYVQRLAAGEAMEISAWAGDLARTPPPAATVVEDARGRRTGPGDAFVIATPDGPDLVAGYPGGTGDLADVGIAYEGLFLSTGRPDEGRELLRALAHRAAEEPGPATGPLWLVHAVDRHVTRTGDTDLAAELAMPLGRLLRQSLAGSVGADELVARDGGKRVEINALWVNALAALGDLLDAAKKDPAEARARHRTARSSFAARFPAAEGWLNDLIEGPPTTYPLGGGLTHDDPTLRPGQILAWSLPHAPLAADAAALRALAPALLTPLGLRTLSPTEYGYQPAAVGDGAVLPWLIGAWADACLAAGLPIDDLLTGFTAHLGEYGLGSVSEWVAGDAPHPGGGRPFSARSVAEFLRVQGLFA